MMTLMTLEAFRASKREVTDLSADAGEVWVVDDSTSSVLLYAGSLYIECGNYNGLRYMLSLENSCEVSDNLADLEVLLLDYGQRAGAFGD